MAIVSDSTLDHLTKYMPMVMVKHGLRAAVNADCAHIVDNVSKVEFRVKPDPHRITSTLELQVWWDLGEGEFHVTSRTTELGGTMAGPDPVEILEALTKFEPEEVLKFAAFL